MLLCRKIAGALISHNVQYPGRTNVMARFLTADLTFMSIRKYNVIQSQKYTLHCIRKKSTCNFQPTSNILAIPTLQYLLYILP